MNFRGHAHKYGDNVDTDVIIPARYLNDSGSDNLRAHVMEDIDPEFATKVRDGDVVVGGKNFGSGSSREHAPMALKAAGVKMIIAESFARIFFRNSINIGLYPVEDSKICANISDGDEIEVSDGRIKNLTDGTEFMLPPLDDFVKNILDRGGLMEAIK